MDITFKHFEVCAAVITRQHDGQTEIFCAQRPGPKPGKQPNETNYKWEFPGGKMEVGETQQQALEREMREEFDTEIKAEKLLCTVEHTYATFSITMHAYLSSLVHGNLLLKEHLDSAWLNPKELMTKEWAAADIPIAQKVQLLFENNN